MPTPKEGYFLKDGTQVPGTTTIIGRFKDCGALMYWAWDQGRQGKSYREESNKAAEAGTLAHEMVEAYIKNQKPESVFEGKLIDQAIINKAQNAFIAYLNWEEQSKLKILHQEIKLISEINRFGGTPDAIGELKGHLCLVDWKTSNGVYSDYLLQIAAYKNLWEENNPNLPITGGYHLCRFAKEHGDFAHHYYPNLDEAWEQFLLFRKAYDLDKQLKKRIA